MHNERDNFPDVSDEELSKTIKDLEEKLGHFPELENDLRASLEERKKELLNRDRRRKSWKQ